MSIYFSSGSSSTTYFTASSAVSRDDVSGYSFCLSSSTIIISSVPITFSSAYSYYSGCCPSTYSYSITGSALVNTMSFNSVSSVSYRDDLVAEGSFTYENLS